MPCGEKTHVPMVSLVCLPREDREVDVCLILELLFGENKVVGAFCATFDARGKTEVKLWMNHKVEVSVSMST